MLRNTDTIEDTTDSVVLPKIVRPFCEYRVMPHTSFFYRLLVLIHKATVKMIMIIGVRSILYEHGKFVIEL